MRLCLLILLMLAIVTWSYWPVMMELFRTLQKSKDYSAGQLVPLVVLFLVWRKRKALMELPIIPCWWGGVALILLAQLGRTYGFLFMRSTAERYSLVGMIAGLVLMVAGRRVFREVVWILSFLFLMFPFPGVVHNLIAGPLQRIATTGSVFLLEAIGISATQEGNVVVLNGDMSVAVAEACSGLRMLTAFIMVAAFIAYMVRRPGWQKGILLASSMPIAVVCNVIRIFLTVMIMLYVGEEVGETFFHDFAGYVMMPVAVMLLFVEIRVLDCLIMPDQVPLRQRHVVVRVRPTDTAAGI